jgi:RimJ/RimL family protein N-acetyltransferase
MLGLRPNMPHLEFRHPSDQELGQLADLSAEGIHEPDQTPSPCPGAVCLRGSGRSVVQQHWPRRGNWSADDWDLDLAVLEDGQIVGPANPRRSRLRDRWQGQHHLLARSAPPGRGIGTEMRAAVLHLAFAAIDATEATSGAFDDNTPSLTVSRKLGYQLDGIERHAVRGRATTTRRLRLSRVQWQNQRIPVSITGLARCRPLFGLEDGGRHELAAPRNDAFRSPQMR